MQQSCAVYEVPAPTPEQAAGIAQRIYGGLLRDLRKTLLDSLGYAVADGREHVNIEDVRLKPTPGKGRTGSRRTGGAGHR
jgi:ATP-dependent Lon protease